MKESNGARDGWGVCVAVVGRRKHERGAYPGIRPCSGSRPGKCRNHGYCSGSHGPWSRDAESWETAATTDH